MVCQGLVHASQVCRRQQQQLLIQLLRIWCSNEARDVDVDEGSHQVLTVEAIHDAPMTWDHVSEVLDLERTLEATRKEAAKGSDHGAEQRESQRVQDEGVHLHLLRESDLW